MGTTHLECVAKGLQICPVFPRFFCIFPDAPSKDPVPFRIHANSVSGRSSKFAASDLIQTPLGPAVYRKITIFKEGQEDRF